ncbi:hypothetical protein [Pedobacter chitinilyticus]|uniref:Helix-turn-helix domain-containing protein n=1 Tax=Pedobacter chitinilyticus TaxID=2233776 RepID=A0A3S3PZD8_9SPHI|nr:hypothetical protein [Pedobacter chitinilyticus]RWU08123.1 hypothetical protein DPV69_07010 [Pedobacter chitinilyticus]
MEQSLLSIFLMDAGTDPRIAPIHISLYAALLFILEREGGEQPIIFKRAELMAISRIGGFNTYHRTLNDLIERGYIRYQPRFDRRGNLAFLVGKKHRSLNDKLSGSEAMRHLQ